MTSLVNNTTGKTKVVWLILNKLMTSLVNNTNGKTIGKAINISSSQQAASFFIMLMTNFGNYLHTLMCMDGNTYIYMAVPFLNFTLD